MNPLLLDNTFYEIVKYIPLTEYKNLMLLSKIHREMIKKILKEYKRNFISSNTVANMNKIFAKFFIPQEIDNFKSLLQTHEGCLAGSSVLQAILGEDFLFDKNSKNDLDIYFDASKEYDLNKILDKFLFKMGYRFDIHLNVNGHKNYDYFSGIKLIRKYTKYEANKITKIDIIYIDTTLTGRNNLKMPKSSICVDTYDYSFLKNVYSVTIDPLNPLDVSKTDGDPSSVPLKECIKIYHIYNIINKYDIRYTDIGGVDSARGAATDITSDTEDADKDKYKKLLPIANFDDNIKKLSSRWLSSLRLLDANQKYTPTVVQNCRNITEKLRLEKYIGRGFIFLQRAV